MSQIGQSTDHTDKDDLHYRHTILILQNLDAESLPTEEQLGEGDELQPGVRLLPFSESSEFCLKCGETSLQTPCCYCLVTW